jgi:hypothetical protein
MRTGFLLLLVMGVVAVIQAAAMPAAPTFGRFGGSHPRPLDHPRIQGLRREWAEAEHVKRRPNDGTIMFGGLRPLKIIDHTRGSRSSASGRWRSTSSAPTTGSSSAGW